MNQEQKNIVKALISEFTRINRPNESKKFNLIDTSDLINKNEKIKQHKDIEQAEKETWNNIAMMEAIDIKNLLSEDLSEYPVQLFGEGNSFHKQAAVVIRQRGATQIPVGHCNNYVAIYVNIKYVQVRDEWGNLYRRGSNLYYTFESLVFNSIGELVNNENFRETLRTRILTT